MHGLPDINLPVAIAGKVGAFQQADGDARREQVARSRASSTFKTVWSKTLRRAKVPYFRIYDLRSTYATRLSAGGVADEWVTQMLRQGDAQVFKKYSQMKLQMKREALEKLNRRASEMAPTTGERMRTVMVQ